MSTEKDAPQEAAAEEAGAEKPQLRVIDAHATPEEVAAIVTVLSALGGGSAPAPAPVRSTWADPARQARRPLTHGGWRASALPR